MTDRQRLIYAAAETLIDGAMWQRGHPVRADANWDARRVVLALLPLIAEHIEAVSTDPMRHYEHCSLVEAAALVRGLADPGTEQQ